MLGSRYVCLFMQVVHTKKTTWSFHDQKKTEHIQTHEVVAI